MSNEGITVIVWVIVTLIFRALWLVLRLAWWVLAGVCRLIRRGYRAARDHHEAKQWQTYDGSDW